MPKRKIDYSKCIIYKIVCNDLNIPECYVGHTTNLPKRIYHHKMSLTILNKQSKVYKKIRENGGWDNWSVVIIEEYPCSDFYQATSRERYWFEQLGTLNTNYPSRTPEEYREDNKQKLMDIRKKWRKDNKEKISEYNQLNREKNKEYMKEYRKEYIDKNRETILQKQKTEMKTCECGRTVRNADIRRHERSEIHLELKIQKVLQEYLQRFKIEI